MTVIVDPQAGGGRGRKQWPDYEKALRHRYGELRVEMIGTGDELGAALLAAGRRGDMLVYIVGDTGSVNEAANALMAAEIAPDDAPEVALLPVGAGSDFARAVGVVGKCAETVVALAEGTSRRIDAVRVQYVAPDGQLAHRHMINTGGLGLSSQIATKVNAARLNRMLSSQIVFFLETVRAMLAFRFPRVRVMIDGRKPIGTKVAEIVLANGRFYGGGMAIAPEARLDDGLLDIVVIRAQSKVQLIDNLNRIYKGGHRNLPFVDILRGGRVVIEPGGPEETLGVVLDGIPVGQAPIVAEIRPRAFKVRTPAIAA